MHDHTRPPPFNVGGPYYYRPNVTDLNGYQRPVTTPISMSETLTLRDQFAMAALTGVINRVGGFHPTVYAEDAYIIADAMLAARGQKK